MFVNSALNNKNLSKEIAQYVCENHFDDYIEVNSQELKGIEKKERINRRYWKTRRRQKLYW